MQKEHILELISRYEAEREHYLSSDYNEAQLRSDFLDPLFEILGWDIKNSQGKLTNEREVLLEESLKEDASSNTKKPDYTFRLFSERKFYLEAKKPNVKVESEPEPAKQVRRYGFTAKLKISVLSNFEHLAIYDCSQKVEEGDVANHSRVKIYHYTEYADVIDEITKELGREGVYSGEFDKTWQHIEEKLKLFSVDSLFLEQINQWRLLLGEEVYSHRPEIDEVQLNDIVQRYLNSIIFLRVSEDRNLEEYKTLLDIATKEDFRTLVQKFHDADGKYNAGLFNHELTEEIIKNNSSAFWEIIRQLYYPESTYSFSVFASDVLGNIYEIYLGQQLAISEAGVVLEKKPERVDRDVVTTPIYIIRDLVRKTVAKHCEGKNEEEILRSKIADIACGSGAFLLEVYQYINDTLIDLYLSEAPEKLIQTSVDSFKLPFDTKRKILESCLYGVDKDFNAVEACKFGLLLKLLEDEDNASIPTPALPELSSVIRYGNSLVEEFSGSERRQVNPFSFGDTRFDVVIGNPPYMATEHMKEFTPLELPIYKEKYISAYKQFDKYFVFVERAFGLLKDDGCLGYIIPSKFTRVGAAKKLRELLRESASPRELISFGANQVFTNKTTYTCLLVATKERQDSLRYLEVKSLEEWKTRAIEDESFDSVRISELDDDGWMLVPGDLKDVFAAINNQSIALSDLVGEENIYNGIQTSANNIYIQTATREDGEYYYFEKGGNDWRIEKALTRPYFKTSGGEDNLNTYRDLQPNSFVIYPYLKNESGDVEFVEINTLESDYPMLYSYLMAHRSELDSESRDIKPAPETPDEWYRYGRHQSLEKCDVPEKIVVGVLSQGDKYAIDKNSTLISSGGTAGYCMITLPQNSKYSISYIQAILNSKYTEWYAALQGEVFRGGYVARGTKVLKKLPIRKIDFDSESEKALHDSIADTQIELTQIQSRIDDNFGNEREVGLLKREFDEKQKQLVLYLKELFGLGEEDSKIPLNFEMYAID